MELGSGPVPLRVVPEKHDWINTLVGILDQAFHLTDDEQYFASRLVGQVLDILRVPERGDPSTLPVPVVLELSAQLYSNQLAGSRDSGVVRPVRPVSGGDVVVSVEAWVESLIGMLVAAYPDLSPEERMMGASMLSEVLDAIGAPDRAAAFLPDQVVRVARDVDAHWW